MRLEDNLQIECVKWYRMQYKHYIITSFPAGYVFSGDQSQRARMGKRMKDMGYLNGMPDLLIPYPNKDYHGLFIELKIGKNKPSIFQQDVMIDLKISGYKVEVCRSIDEFMNVVNEYLK